MRGLRKGRDGLFPKIKYRDYMLITLGEVNGSEGACDGQNPELPCTCGDHPRHSSTNTSGPSGEKVVYAI